MRLEGAGFSEVILFSAPVCDPSDGFGHRLVCHDQVLGEL